MFKKFSYKRGGKISNQPSAFLPTEEERARTAQVLKDYQYSSELMNKTWPEFNDRSLVTEMNVNQKAFNSYVPPLSDDPNDSWRAQTVRPITRNKLISIAAHITTRILYPNIFAQNEQDEEDRDAAEVMRDLIEWVIENSNYELSFLQAVISALVDPAVILEARYAEVMRTVKRMTTDKNDDGTYKYKIEEIVDEVLSGFQSNVIPCNHLLIANIYEPNIQKQRFLIKKRYIDYNEAVQIYGDYKNFKHVKVGVISAYDDTTKTFYDVRDEESKSYLVLETVYYHRTLDLEIPFLNGIIMGGSDAPLRREDKMYPFAKTGYEPLNNGQFFYYKSCANKLGSDQSIVDTLYNLIIDGSFMALMPPMAIFGGEDHNSAVMIPGASSSFSDPNTKIESLAPKIDLRGGMEALGMVERSMSESSQDSIRGGNAQGGERTAREIILLDKNAQTALGLFGKMIGFMVEDFGRLIIGDILQHMTVAQVDEITNETKYRKFLLADRIVGGRKVTKQLQFDQSLLNTPEMNDEEMMTQSYDLLSQEGGLDADKKIYKINPKLFRDYKYKCRVNADELIPKTKEIEKALKLEAFDRLIPLAGIVDQKAVTRDFLLDQFVPGNGDKYVLKDDVMKQQQIQDMASGVNAQPENKTSMLSQITGSNSLGAAASTQQ